MLKKSLICTFIMIILSLCCTMCFAAENGNNINLGNEIKESIDKTENSMKNVISGNVVNDAGNMMQEGANTINGGMEDVKDGTRDVVDGNNYDMNDNRDNRDNEEENAAGVNNDNGYNTTRTSADQTLNGGINTMTATTWMWIILIVAAVTIMAAIWYYATQGNK